MLSSTRTDARLKGMEILLLYMEIDVPDPVIVSKYEININKNK